eukprot:CAMPEP_0115844966 /NCGR_PEP_ID=MMETSP0287-20121206/9102_1 /TAXON_ID=412157 /ORGANISM="Chrysochromulina rotalis, Strain UIO044" /LENGTH=141 /DNA_ID=CAMNT_0003298711 /DNA_START=200 /DNA_END=623 /DNA_ORIENTATION=+
MYDECTVALTDAIGKAARPPLATRATDCSKLWVSGHDDGIHQPDPAVDGVDGHHQYDAHDTDLEAGTCQFRACDATRKSVFGTQNMVRAVVAARNAIGKLGCTKTTPNNTAISSTTMQPVRQRVAAIFQRMMMAKLPPRKL